MQRIKLLYFTNIPSPYRIDFFNMLGEHVDLTVLFERKDADDRDSIWMSIEDKILNFSPVFLKGIKIGQDSAISIEALKYWRDKQYDIRIVGDYATPTGILSVLYMQLLHIEYDIECDGGFVRDSEGKIKRTIKNTLLKKTRYAYSPGELTDKYLINYGLLPQHIIRYHFSSITENDIRCAREARKNRELYRNKFGLYGKKVVLFVGQIIQRKGVDLLIKSASLLSDEFIILVVGGELTNAYKEIIEQYNVTNVTFLGFKQKEEIREYYAAADLFFLPTREDIWGLVIAEAMSYGLPVVTTDKCVAGVELLNNQKYAIVCSENYKQMAESIQTIMRDYWIDYGRQNFKIAQSYTIEQMTKDHLSSFERKQ